MRGKHPDIAFRFHLIALILGTNFPPELYDGHLFGKESYYEELSKVQKEEMDRREKVMILNGIGIY